jgi:type I restriction enzyme M protein
LYQSGRNQNTLEAEHSNQIFAWYCDYKDVAGAVRIITLEEMAQNDWNLNIPRYVEPVVEEGSMKVEEAVANLKAALAEAYAAEEKLKQLLQNAGLIR